MNITGCKPSLNAGQFIGKTSWFDAYQKVVVPIIEGGDLVGINIADTSRMISFDQINDPAGRNQIKKFILNSHVPFIFQNSNYSPATF